MKTKMKTKMKTIRATRAVGEAARLGGACAAIITRYRGETDRRGARIIATLAGAGRRPRVSIPYRHELSGLACHVAAALTMLDGMNSSGANTAAFALVSAGGVDGGYAFTLRYGTPTAIAAPILDDDGMVDDKYTQI